MPNYQLGKIYKIVCNTTGKVYYGSTCEPTLARRLAKHVGCYKFWKNGNNEKKGYITSFLIIENNDYDIILVEKCPCDDKMDLLKRERYYIENNECVNKSIPSRTTKEYKKIYYEENKNELINGMKEYYEINNKKIKDKSKKYRIENIEIVKAHANVKHECSCGGKYTSSNKSTHEKSKMHLNYIANNNINEQ